MMDSPSPWLAREQRYERHARHARHARRVATALRIALHVLVGGTAAGATVLILQAFGVLPK